MAKKRLLLFTLMMALLPLSSLRVIAENPVDIDECIEIIRGVFRLQGRIEV